MKKTILIIFLLLLLVGCNKPVNDIKYKTFDDGNCGELGYCPPPKDY